LYSAGTERLLSLLVLVLLLVLLVVLEMFGSLTATAR
jgi:hypothetical protein